MKFRNLPLIALASLLAVAAADARAPQATPAPAPAQTTVLPNPTVGGAVMDPARPIAVNAAAAPNLSTLVTAVKAADLVATLSGPGPFTVFAPDNDAFSRLDPSTMTTLMKPTSKAALTKVLTYHVVPGAFTLADLKAKTTAGGGTATLATVEGEPLSLTEAGGAYILTDTNGNKSYITTPDVRQSNGVVHVVNGVLIPKNLN